jgi:radical SAM protein with 4Fe4S-binding SPASM domain
MTRQTEKAKRCRYDITKPEHMKVHTLIYPDKHVLLERIPDTGLRMTDTRQSLVYEATGSIADKIEEVLHSNETLETLPLLESLPFSHLIQQMRESGAHPLTAENALRKCGFGTLFLELSGTCNERCVHCYASASPTKRQRLSDIQCKTILDDALSLGFKSVQFTGGEPLLHPALTSLLAYARNLGFQDIEIYTNATLLYGNRLEKLLPYKPNIAVSVYSHQPEIHDAMTRLPGSFERTIAGISQALDAGLDVRVGLIVNEKTAGSERKTIEFLNKIGIDKIRIAGTLAVGRAKTSQPYFDMGHDAGDPHTPGNEHSAMGTLCVTYEGDVCPCVFNRNRKLGNIHSRRLLSIATDPEITATADNDPDNFNAQLACASCRLTEHALQHLNSRPGSI